MLVSPRFSVPKLSSSPLPSVSSSCEIIASTSKSIASPEAAFLSLPPPSTPPSPSVDPNSGRVQRTTPQTARYTAAAQSPMTNGNTQIINDLSDYQEPPAKRIKVTPKKAKSTSPRGSKKKRSLSTHSPRLFSGVITPDRVRSPGARSRSTTDFGSLEGIIPRPCCTGHDGSFGEDLVTAEKVVKRLMKSYKAYFSNPSDPTDRSFDPHPTQFPYVVLEYPNTNSREVFPLLIPKDEDHYSPVKEVKKSLFTIIETFLTPSQAALFGTPPSQLRPSDFAPPKSDLALYHPSNRQQSKSITLTPLSNDLLLTLTHANNTRNGPLFISTFNQISELLRSLKKGDLDDDGFRVDLDRASNSSQIRPIPDPNPIRKLFQGWNGVPPHIWKTIIDETYQRAVGPNIPLLRKYPAWSSEAYGELETEFVSDIVHYTGLKPTSRFFDMGSGVGTVVLQIALQAGCMASGIEKMKHPAAIAEQHLEQFQKRCRMWGVEPGPTELLTGDFTDDDRVRERILNADVVLCNNWAFSEKQVNQSLLNHFLDMKEGAVVVSLRSFIPPNFRLTEHTIGSPAAILRVEERPFQAGSVSWMSGGGVYFINTIDRRMVAVLHDQLSKGRAPRTRSVKTRQS
ncbi:hypothetical protein Clacol_003624 [Clathrus columnatus]|uniref:Histone-lysine N-methyltransferase, H3 lysine-79 specific n=1 Tax=Clathrus columnatus TaxID=1419009 RepID=A0AAV5A7B6_9AGAM|nr:hypothetical protein Clacol_003624 [Clathrus columnatus]